jgi:hypothetical protein
VSGESIPGDTMSISKIKPLKGIAKVKPKAKAKSSNANQFLSGVDMGLDLIEQVVPRVERFFRLRG